MKRPPLPVAAFRSVGALGPVVDRVVHVELHVAVAGVVLREAGGDEPLGVPVLSRRRRVVPGPHVSSFPLRHGHHPVVGPLHRSAHLLGLLGEPLRLRFVPRGFRFGGGQERGPQDGHRFRRAEGQIIERDHRPELAAELQPDSPDLFRGDEPAPGGYLRGHLGLDPLIQRPAPGRVVRFPLPPGQHLAARADVLVVQPPHHLGVDLPGQAERLGAAALPVAGWLTLRAGEVISPGRGTAHGAGQVTDVVCAMQPGHHRQLPPLGTQAARCHRAAQRARPRSSFVMQGCKRSSSLRHVSARPLHFAGTERPRRCPGLSGAGATVRS